jgi:glycerol-1-phosphate dehydrogenase [NAD(P)+]
MIINIRKEPFNMEKRLREYTAKADFYLAREIAGEMHEDMEEITGSETMLVRYWQQRGILNTEYEHALGIAVLVIAEFYEWLEDDIPYEAFELVPKRGELERELRQAGYPVLPEEIGIDRDTFYQSVIAAYTIGENYGILQLAVEKGRVEEITREITERIYG